MKCLYQLVTEAWFKLLSSTGSCSSPSERKTFPQLGRNIVYDFGDSDFEVTVVSDAEGDGNSCWIEQSKNRKSHFCLLDISLLRPPKVR